jgi:hypothetical protein
MVGGFGDDPPDPRYAGYSDCFNRQHFYVAPDVLEDLRLKDREGFNGALPKGLIRFPGGNAPKLALERPDD